MKRYFFNWHQCLMVMMLSIIISSAHAAPFEQGDLDFSLVVGSGHAFNDNYTIIGAGIGYYVLDGLRLGVNGETWQGGDISVNKYSAQVQYVMLRDEKIKPYLGTFFRRASISGFDDLDSVGGRAGVYLSGRSNYYVSIGFVRENHINCNETIYVSCSDSYSEVAITFSL